LRDCSRFVGEGIVRAVLHQLDGYTGMVPDSRSTNLVRGEIFEIIEPAQLWPVLESYEGSAFECQTVEAVLDGGQTLTVRAYVYVR
jgi:Gamma-glutamyl cyclotransferase, AIG2-like